MNALGSIPATGMPDLNPWRIASMSLSSRLNGWGEAVVTIKVQARGDSDIWWWMVLAFNPRTGDLLSGSADPIGARYTALLVSPQKLAGNIIDIAQTMVAERWGKHPRSGLGCGG